MGKAQVAHSLQPGFLGGIFLIILSVLMLEVAMTRIFSVILWYHFAFMAISLALFGLSASAILVGRGMAG